MNKPKILIIYGSRPEAMKLAPIIQALKQNRDLITQTRKTLGKKKPDMVLVNGDTACAERAAKASFRRRIPVGHLETGDPVQRRQIRRFSELHFVSTETERIDLLAEGIPNQMIVRVGDIGKMALRIAGSIRYYLGLTQRKAKAFNLN